MKVSIPLNRNLLLGKHTKGAALPLMVADSKSIHQGTLYVSNIGIEWCGGKKGVGGGFFVRWADLSDKLS